jgi:hypothetical protein
MVVYSTLLRSSLHQQPGSRGESTDRQIGMDNAIFAEIFAPILQNKLY